MPEIKVTLDPKVHQKLKEYAKETGRSLTNYIERVLTFSANSSSNPLKDIFVFATSVPASTTPTPTPTPTLEQLQEQGISQIKFNKTPTSTPLTPEEEQLQQLKMQRQLDTLKEQRVRFLKQKANEMLDFTLPYLENNDQKTINFILDKYPTNDDIIKYLQEVKLADESLENQDDDNLFSYEYEQDIKDREEKLLLPVETNETYRKIRAYAIKNKLTTQLYHLLEYPHFDLDAITQEVENELLRPALGSPLDYEFDQLELNELTKCLSWEE